MLKMREQKNHTAGILDFGQNVSLAQPLLNREPPTLSKAENIEPSHRLLGSLSALEVLSERVRQVEEKGFDVAHDQRHTNGELAVAAQCYLDAALQLMSDLPLAEVAPTNWPFSDAEWKPCISSRGNLLKAAALIVAQMDRTECEVD